MHTWYYGFLIGLAGSWHCLAMCGPLLATIQQKGHASFRMIWYPLGRIFMYMLMGFAVAGLGSIWLFPAWWQVYYLLAGLFILLVLTQKIGDQALQFLHRSLGQYFKKIGKRFGAFGYFFLGMSNGLLPCGLVIAGLGVAMIQPNPYLGALAMGAFGIATMPALQLFLWGNQKFAFGKLKYIGWFVAALLLFRGAWGIGMSQSAYLRNAKISPIICHPFSEFRP